MLYNGGNFRTWIVRITSSLHLPFNHLEGNKHLLQTYFVPKPISLDSHCHLTPFEKSLKVNISLLIKDSLREFEVKICILISQYCVSGSKIFFNYWKIKLIPINTIYM